MWRLKCVAVCICMAGAGVKLLLQIFVVLGDADPLVKVIFSCFASRSTQRIRTSNLFPCVHASAHRRMHASACPTSCSSEALPTSLLSTHCLPLAHYPGADSIKLRSIWRTMPSSFLNSQLTAMPQVGTKEQMLVSATLIDRNGLPVLLVDKWQLA